MTGVTLTLPEVMKRAVAAYERGQLREADRLARAILGVKADCSDALHLIAVIKMREHRLDEAVACYDRALAVRPDYPEALSNRGLALQGLKRFDEALASYDGALAVRPDYAEALSNRGNALTELKRFDEALASYDRALAMQPDYAEALYNRANTLHQLKRFDEALACYDRALAVRPDFAEALSNRGNTLRQLKRFDEALVCYDRALAVRPDYADAIYNRANALQQLKRFDEALACYDRALAVQPDFAEAHGAKSLLLLLIGDLDAGWQEHECRWKYESLKPFRQDFAQPLWLGETGVEGNTILLHSEQGFGDTIQFIRYVPLLAELGAKVIIRVQPALKKLLADMAGADIVIGTDEELPPFDLYTPLLSLPLAFKTRLDTIPSATPYLRASSEAVAHWNARLGHRSRPRIGLAWSGRPTHKNDHNRSIGLGALLPLLDFNATYVSLQKDVRPGDASVLQNRSDLLHFGDDLKTFADAAALLSNLDLIISVDTSVVHLAGALAKPVWVLLPFLPDWRWLLDRDDSPWYPTARLFRQNAPGDWAGVIGRVITALEKLFHKTASSKEMTILDTQQKIRRAPPA